MKEAVEQVQKNHPEAKVELWSMDEHRLGTQPIIKGQWMFPEAEPVAIVHPGYEWLYLFGFVHPEKGETYWLLMPTVSLEIMNLCLQEFAQGIGAGKDKHIVLVLDGAGWHGAKQLKLPEGLHLVYLPSYSPELQPAERLWQLTDEPLVNRLFQKIGEIEEVLAERCRILFTMTDAVRRLTFFHWWPRISSA